MTQTEKNFDAAAAQQRGRLLHEAIGAAARRVGAEHAAEVERRILDGENDFTVLVGDPSCRVSHRYQVPSPWRHPIHRARIAHARFRHRRHPKQAEPPPPPSAVAVVVDFLSAWRFCPLASSPNATQGDLEDAAKQLLDALTEAERGEVQRRRTQARLDKLFRRQLLLRRLQLFPVEWIKLADAQEWMGVTEHEAEEALFELAAEEVIHVDALGRWALNSQPRREAIEKPLVDLPFDAAEERRRRAAWIPPHHVRQARELLRQAAPAIRKERSTRLDGPLMSVLDALDELEKADAGSHDSLLFVLDSEQARIVQEFVEGTRGAARNPQERALLKRLRVFAEDGR